MWNRRIATWTLALTTAAVLAGCGLMITPPDPTSRLPPLRPPSARHFERVVIVVLENQDESQAIRDPYLMQLARQGAYLANFRGLFHNSYPNYIAMVSGTVFNFAEIRGRDSDRQVDWPADHRSIADELEAKGLRWKAYAEDYPGRPGDPAPFLGDGTGTYRRKHVPLLSYTNITETASGKRRFDNVVSVRSSDPQNAFAEAVRAGTLPEYSFYTPNMDNDAHDTSLGYASAWLKSFLSHGGYAPRDATDAAEVRGFPNGTLIVVTFDESAGRSPHNRIYTALLGDMVCRTVSRRAYNHYNVLSTIVQNFGLSPLADGDAWARPIDDVWAGPSPGTCAPAPGPPG
jgi:hypothetical protein